MGPEWIATRKRAAMALAVSFCFCGGAPDFGAQAAENYRLWPDRRMRPPPLLPRPAYPITEA